jgi:LPXTG-motif cell wall-anchored protein
MKQMKTAGIIIIIVGLVLTIFTAFTFFTKEKVVDIGKIEISRDEPHKLNWSPLIGIAVMGIGGVVLWRSNKK